MNDAMLKMLDASADLGLCLNELIDHHDSPTETVMRADWAFYRFVTLSVLVRERDGGVVGAGLARSLLEEASLWDWSLGSAVTDLPDRWAGHERARLGETAVPGDSIWLEWLLPPGTRLTGVGHELPDMDDAVKRIGVGLSTQALDPLRLIGLYGAYQLLKLVSHGGPAAVLLVTDGRTTGLSDWLSAVSLHIGGAAAGALVATQLDLGQQELAGLSLAEQRLADAATAVHGLPLGVRVVRVAARAKRSRSVPRPQASAIGLLPAASPITRDAARDFVRAAKRFMSEFYAVPAVAQDFGALLGYKTVQVAFAHLRVLEGAVEGTLGDALVPYAARTLFEDVARLGWFARQVDLGSGRALEALLGEAQSQLKATRELMLNEGIPANIAVAELSRADPLAVAPLAKTPSPPIAELLDVAYGVDARHTPFALPMYSILSQFVHATPIAAMHLKRATFHSLSAPAFAVAVEAACLGFWSIATVGSALALGAAPSLAAPRRHLEAALGKVHSASSRFHFLD